MIRAYFINDEFIYYYYKMKRESNRMKNKIRKRRKTEMRLGEMLNGKTKQRNRSKPNEMN